MPPNGNVPMYKILDAYKSKTTSKVTAALGVGGLAALVAGALIDSTPVSISGATGFGSAIVGEGINYMKAYFEARLDYLKNDRFTRIEE